MHEAQPLCQRSLIPHFVRQSGVIAVSIGTMDVPIQHILDCANIVLQGRLQLKSVVLQVYEQIKPDSMFGRQMIRNLEERGAPLYGVHATPSLEAHKERLLSCGWNRAFAEDMLTLYRGMLDPKDRARVEGIELFDEFEEWDLIMSHYCMSVGVKDKLGMLSAFNVDTTRHAATPHFTPSAMRHNLPNAD